MALTQVSTGGIKDGQVHTADLADAQITAGKLHADALDHTYTLGASGTDHYTFTGEGLTGAVNDPTLYLTRGKTYRFVNGNSAGAHPFRIQTTVNGSAGTEYNTGVTNNGGAGGSTIIFEVPHAAPDVLYYQCTSHGSMGGILYVTGALADGTVTTAKLADQAVTLAKLPHGTSSNDGKFLRANNGADPSFETVSIPAGTTINNNADNRVITGSGTANTLNAESNVVIDSSGRLGLGVVPSDFHSNNSAVFQLKDGNSIFSRTGGQFLGIFQNIKYNSSDVTQYIANGLGSAYFQAAGEHKFYTVSSGTANNNATLSERMRIDSSGKVGINTSTPIGTLDVYDGTFCLTKPSGNASSRNWRFLADNAAAGNLGLQVSTAAGGSTFSNVLEIDSSGNVGIGTTSPASKLHVDGANSGGAIVTIHNTAGSSSSDAGLEVETSTTGAFTQRWLNAGTELARINGSGQFFIASTDGSLWNNTDAGSGWSFLPSYGTVATKTDRATGYANMYINKTNTGSGSDERWINFIWDGWDYGNIRKSGSGVNYQSNSDYRLKENIVSLTGGITRLKNLKPSRFNWISEPNVTVDGFIAHEAQTVVPESVDGVKDQVADDSNVDKENGKPIYQKMDNAKLVPLLTAALQEAIAKIETLETKVAALEAA